MLLAVGVFVVALAVIASERMDRTKVALIGAMLMLLAQTIDQEQAIEAVDFNTIGLLAGMMLMVTITQGTGVYTWLAIRAGLDDELGPALRTMLDSELPALPVVNATERYCGVFGEREFLAALFPAYLGTLGYAGFVPDDLDEALEQRATCVHEPVGAHLNREHVDLSPTASNASIAETFLHHRVLIVPVVDHGTVIGVASDGRFVAEAAAFAVMVVGP